MSRKRSISKKKSSPYYKKRKNSLKKIKRKSIKKTISSYIKKSLKKRKSKRRSKKLVSCKKSYKKRALYDGMDDKEIIEAAHILESLRNATDKSNSTSMIATDDTTTVKKKGRHPRKCIWNCENSSCSCCQCNGDIGCSHHDKGKKCNKERYGRVNFCNFCWYNNNISEPVSITNQNKYKSQYIIIVNKNYTELIVVPIDNDSTLFDVRKYINKHFVIFNHFLNGAREILPVQEQQLNALNLAYKEHGNLYLKIDTEVSSVESKFGHTVESSSISPPSSFETGNTLSCNKKKAGKKRKKHEALNDKEKDEEDIVECTICKMKRRIKTRDNKKITNFICEKVGYKCHVDKSIENVDYLNEKEKTKTKALDFISLVSEFGKEITTTPNLNTTYLNENVLKGGYGIYANKKFTKGDIVIFYLTKIYDRKNIVETDIDFKYLINLEYFYDNPLYIDKVGVLFSKSNLTPVTIPHVKDEKTTFLGYLCNEPSLSEEDNCKIERVEYNSVMWKKSITDEDIKDNISNKYCLFKLVATKDINKDDEILWCYGENYDREYETSCTAKEDFDVDDVGPKTKRKRIENESSLFDDEFEVEVVVTEYESESEAEDKDKDKEYKEPPPKKKHKIDGKRKVKSKRKLESNKLI